MFGQTPLIMVESDEALLAMVEQLRDAPVVGVDTEGDSFHHYREKVCLIQLSDLQQDYIVDPLQINDLNPLGEIMANPEQVKILHGADYDVVCMKRDFQLEFRNLFDTMISAQFLGLPGVGLADLINRYFGVYIDKKYQRYDWSRRPLQDEHLAYARGDTHWLPALRELLNLQLERSGKLDAVLEECALVEAREWKERGDKETQFLKMKGAGTLDVGSQKVLRCLWEYRDGQAENADRPAFKVIPDPILLMIAQRKPTTDGQLREVARRGSSMMRRHADGLLAAVDRGSSDERPIPKVKVEKRRSSTRSGRGIDRYLGPLKQWRNDRVKRDGIAPVAVVNNTLLKEIARLAPTCVAELEAVPGIRKWQVREFADELIAVVAKIPTAPGGGGGGRRRRTKKE
jgi:ribonuclease D